MHMIQAIVKPSAVEAIKAGLADLDVLGCTALECKGYGRQKGHTERYRGGRMEVGFVPKVLLQVAVTGEALELALRAIADAARTGSIGDGKLFVHELTSVVRIRTGEQNHAAL